MYVNDTNGSNAYNTTGTASSSQTQNCSIFVNSSKTSPWISPATRAFWDRHYAVDDLSSDGDGAYLIASGCAFNIPTTASINGIAVSVYRHAGTASAIQDNSILVVKDNSTTGITDHYSAAYWGTTNAYSSYGNSTDLWGVAWTPADINNATTGWEIQATGAALVYIDYMNITVYYTYPTIAGTTRGST